MFRSSSFILTFLASVTDCSGNRKNPIIQVCLVPTSKLFLLALESVQGYLKKSVFYFFILGAVTVRTSIQLFSIPRSCNYVSFQLVSCAVLFTRQHLT